MHLWYKHKIYSELFLYGYCKGKLQYQKCSYKGRGLITIISLFDGVMHNIPYNIQFSPIVNSIWPKILGNFWKKGFEEGLKFGKFKGNLVDPGLIFEFLRGVHKG